MASIESLYFYVFALFSFLVGLNFGSFANVCIYRMPLDLSVVRPRSSCPKCKKMIAWHDNIPVFSYLLLAGKCRGCGAKISVMYPTVEFLTAVLFVLVFFKYGVSVQLFLFWLLAFSLVVISAIDIYHRIIPDIFPLILVVAGLALSVFNTTLGDGALHRLLNSAVGILAGGGSLFLVGVFGKFIYKKEAMGGGDVKLMAGVGAVIGWERVLFAIFLASFIGSIAGLFMMLSKRMKSKEYLPFGPFLSAGAYAALFLPAPGVLINMLFVWESAGINKIMGF